MNETDPTMMRFRENVVMTIAELAAVSLYSTITVRRRLKEWGAHTSYNCNGRYYVLPEIPTFNVHGLWNYGEVRFSKFGTLTATAVQLVNASVSGLSAAELSELLGYQMHPVLSRLTQQGALQRVRDGGSHIYFSTQPRIFDSQNEKSKFHGYAHGHGLSQEAKICLLVEKIKQPSFDAAELVACLRRNGHGVNSKAVESFLQSHDLLKKN